MINIKTVTNRIIYNRLKRDVTNILRHNVFEQNDNYTREHISTEIRRLLNNLKTFSIKDYKYSISDFDRAKPHYIEINIVLLFKNMIEYVHLNITNTDF